MSKKRFGWAIVISAASGTLALPAQAQSGQAMAQTCYVCHGPGAKGAGPIVGLVGLPKDHVVRQMADFKADKRPGTIMNRIAKGYTDEQLALIAEYLAALK